MQVLKIGGNKLGEAGFLDRLGQVVAGMAEPVVVVHGGGQAISDMQARLGLKTKKVDGLRVTDAESLVVSQMVLSGDANKTIVVALLAAGVDAAGISGVDGGLLRCVKKQHSQVDLGYVGQIVDVRPHLINSLLDQGITPVISPISLGVDGQVYNVNADEAAAALATALPASMVNFISDVPAVLDQDKQPILMLTPSQTERLITKGVIYDGMVPKVRAAIKVIGQGVPYARVVDLSGLANGSGTVFGLNGDGKTIKGQ